MIGDLLRPRVVKLLGDSDSSVDNSEYVSGQVGHKCVPILHFRKGVNRGTSLLDDRMGVINSAGGQKAAGAQQRARVIMKDLLRRDIV